MAAGQANLGYENFHIGWICAIDLELQAARAMLDEVYTGRFPKEPGDENSYEFGRIEAHHIVIVILPLKTYGTNAAAVVGANMKRSFPHISIFLMVGIGGGAPRYNCAPKEEFDIRLGDVVVSEPTSKSSGVIQYDMGKTLEGAEWSEHVGILDKASPEIRAEVVKFKVKHQSAGEVLQATLDERVERQSRLDRKFLHQGVENDLLFASRYKHHESSGTCDSCDKSQLISRPRRSTTNPRVHYGIIGSGNQVIKDSNVRDSWRDRENIICFEMEAAGLMDTLRCLVIRGIADFGDSHKNDRWQPYASATAAAYARNLILSMPPYQPPAAMAASSRDADEKLIRLFALVDSEAEKRRILGSKERLRSDLCSWIFEDISYQAWEQSKGQSRHFWLHGDPGKGKTMITASLVQRLSGSSKVKSGEELMAFFFCQQAEARLNSASAILCGLIHYLVSRNYHLLLRLKAKVFSRIEKFGTAFSFSELWDILMHLVQCASSQVFLIVDALDECSYELQSFLDYMENFQAPPNLKWFFTSRNDTKLYESLAHSGTHFCLETHPKNLMASVHRFIHYEVQELAKRKNYPADLTKKVETHLQNNADGTFLWASLVCGELRETRASRTENVLQMYPPGLTLFYERILKQIQSRLEIDDVKDCERLLCASALAFEPLHINFFGSMNGRTKTPLTKSEVLEIIDLCGSFLEARYDKVYFIHQSAKDFLAKNALWRTINDPRGIHLDISLTCLSIIPQMSRPNGSLVMNGLRVLSYTSNEGENVDAKIGYACKYWGYHLYGNEEEFDARFIQSITQFFRATFLSWIVILEMLGERAKILETLALIKHHAYSRNADIYDMSQHAIRLINQFDSEFLSEGALHANTSPKPSRSRSDTNWERFDALDAYTSALLFSPHDSIIKKAYASAVPNWLDVIVGVDRGWSQYMRTIRVSDKAVEALAFSADSRYIVSSRRGFKGSKIETWNLATGQLLSTLQTALDITCMVVSPDSSMVAAGSFSGTVLLWNLLKKTDFSMKRSGLPESNRNTMIAFSPDGSVLVVGSKLGLVQLWDTKTWQERIYCTAHESKIMSISFDGDRMITTESNKVRHCLWSIEKSRIQDCIASGEQAEAQAEALTSKGLSGVRAIADRLYFFDLDKEKSLEMDTPGNMEADLLTFSPDNQQIGLVSHAGVRIIHQSHSDGFQVNLIDRKLEHIRAATISPDGATLACATYDGLIALMDLTIGPEYYQHVERDLERPVDYLACSSDGSLIAQASCSGTVKLIQASSGYEIAILYELWQSFPKLISFSPDGKYLAVGIVSKLCLWDVSENSFQIHVDMPCRRVSPLGLFSPNGKLFAFLTDPFIEVIDVNSGQLVYHIDSLGDLTRGLDFSPCSDLLAFESNQPGYRSLVIWDLKLNDVRHVIPATSIMSLLFSPDGKRIACITNFISNGTANGKAGLEVWDVETQQLLASLRTSHDSVKVWLDPDTLVLEDIRGELLYRVQIGSNEDEYRPQHLEPRPVQEVPSSALKWVGPGPQGLHIGFKKALWLPPSHRPSRLVARGSTVAMINEQNRLTVLRIDLDKIVRKLYPLRDHGEPPPIDKGANTPQAMLRRIWEHHEDSRFTASQRSELEQSRQR